MTCINLIIEMKKQNIDYNFLIGSNQMVSISGVVVSDFFIDEMKTEAQFIEFVIH